MWTISVRGYLIFEADAEPCGRCATKIILYAYVQQAARVLCQVYREGLCSVEQQWLIPHEVL